MIKKMIFLSVLSLTGCSALTPTPSTTSADPLAATISNYQAGVMATGNTAVIQNIDGRAASYSVWGGQATKSVMVTPGTHTLSVMNEVNAGVFSIPRRNIIEMPVNVKANHHYQLQLKTDQNKTLNWLSDEQGDKASAVVTALYKATV